MPSPEVMPGADGFHSCCPLREVEGCRRSRVVAGDGVRIRRAPHAMCHGMSCSVMFRMQWVHMLYPIPACRRSEPAGWGTFMGAAPFFAAFRFVAAAGSSRRRVPFAARIEGAAVGGNPCGDVMNCHVFVVTVLSRSEIRPPLASPRTPIRGPSLTRATAAAGEERDRPPGPAPDPDPGLPPGPGLGPGSALTRRPG